MPLRSRGLSESCRSLAVPYMAPSAEAPIGLACSTVVVELGESWTEPIPTKEPLVAPPVKHCDGLPDGAAVMSS